MDNHPELIINNTCFYKLSKRWGIIRKDEKNKLVLLNNFSNS
jgi:hypothetical protein